MNGMIIGALVAGIAVAPSLSFGQSATLTPFEKLPDWSGLWKMTGGTVFDNATKTGKGGAVDAGVRNNPPYTPANEKKYDEHLTRRDENRFPDVITNCGVPVGYPRIFNLPDGYEFMVRPDEFYIITENGPNTMRVYTDGRPLPKQEDTWGTYTGVSVGHWEGDTLVWQTRGLKGDRDGDSILDRTGAILSDAAQITTRMRKINDTTLQVVMTIEDSKALTKPWVVTKNFRKQKPGEFMYDYGCAENNRNPVNAATGETMVRGSDGKATSTEGR